MSNTTVATNTMSQCFQAMDGSFFKSQEEARLWDQPMLCNEFPLVVGDYQFEKINAVCGRCGCLVCDSEFHGKISQHHKMLNLEGLALCKSCNVITSIDVRFYGDGRMLIYNGFEWMTMNVRKNEGLLKKLKKLLF